MCVDDGSRDHTWGEIQRLKSAVGWPLVARQNRENLGLVETLKRTYRYVLENLPEVTHVVKLDADEEDAQGRALLAMTRLAHQGADVGVGVRGLDLSECGTPYEKARHADVRDIFRDRLAAGWMQPASAGVQMYRAESLRELLTHPLAVGYERRWGLDVLLPLLATRLDLTVDWIRMSGSDYDPARRPDDKVRLQYDTYVEIAALLLDAEPASLSALYRDGR